MVIFDTQLSGSRHLSSLEKMQKNSQNPSFQKRTWQEFFKSENVEKYSRPNQAKSNLEKDKNRKGNGSEIWGKPGNSGNLTFYLFIQDKFFYRVENLVDISIISSRTGQENLTQKSEKSENRQENTKNDKKRSRIWQK